MATANPTALRRPATRIQKATRIVGALFLLVGVLGFIPGITTGYHALHFAGHESDALLLGLFQVSVLHNIVHLLFGAAALVLARTPVRARNFLIGGGVAYLFLWLYGLYVGDESAANFVPLNNADNWLHLILGFGMLALGVWLARDAANPDTRGRAKA